MKIITSWGERVRNVSGWFTAHVEQAEEKIAQFLIIVHRCCWIPISRPPALLGLRNEKILNFYYFFSALASCWNLMRWFMDHWGRLKFMSNILSLSFSPPQLHFKHILKIKFKWADENCEIIARHVVHVCWKFQFGGACLHNLMLHEARDAIE